MWQRLVTYPPDFRFNLVCGSVDSVCDRVDSVHVLSMRQVDYDQQT